MTLLELSKEIIKLIKKNPDSAKFDAVDIELEDIQGIEILNDDSDQNPIVVIG